MGTKITINPDVEYVKQMRESLFKNGGFCPCVLSKNDDTKCVCKEFLEQETEGWCHCHLYYKQIVE